MAQTQRLNPSRQEIALAAVKAVHTAAWFSIESCMAYVLYAGFKGQSDRRAAVAASVVAAETLVFAVNGFRCPLTDLADHLGAEQASVTDIFLPRWFAHNLPAIHVPLVLLAAILHGRSIYRGIQSGRQNRRVPRAEPGSWPTAGQPENRRSETRGDQQCPRR